MRITRPFYLGVTEVTQAQYEAVMGNNPSWFAATGGGKDKVAGQSTGQHPVESVSWLDAVKFCNKLSELEGRRPFYEINGETVRVPDWKASGYRLPTEAEWEYACGGDPADLDEHAWFDGNSGSVTHPVGKKLTNRFGLHDMLGNVWEWCWDSYDKDYYKQSPRDDPTGPDGASDRVFRGGGWDGVPRIARSAVRSGSRRRTGATTWAFAWPEFSPSAELRDKSRRACGGSTGGAAEPRGGAQPVGAGASPAGWVGRTVLLRPQFTKCMQSWLIVQSSSDCGLRTRFSVV